MKKESEEKLNKCINYIDLAIFAGSGFVFYFLMVADDIGPIPVVASILFVGFLYGIKATLNQIVDAEGK